MEFRGRVAGVSDREVHDRRMKDVDGLPRLAQGGLANLAGAGFAGAAGFGVAWLVARGLGPDAAGVFFAAVAGFVLVLAVARLGTPTGLVYWIARLRAQGRGELVGACLRAGIPPVAATATVLAVGLWFGAPWLGAAVAGSGDAGAATAVLRALAPFLPLAALTDAALAASRGYRLMRPTVVLDKVLRPALQLLGLGTLAALALWTSVPSAAWPLAWALPYAPVVVLAGYALQRTHRPGRTDPGVARAFWRFTAPRAVASVLQQGLQRVDIILVAVLAGPAAAALYTVAGRFVLLGQLANQALGYALQPRLAERLGAGDIAGVRTLYQTATGWLVLITWPLYLLVANYAPLYLGLFGDAYRTGGTIVAVLAAAMMLATACGTVDMLLAMAGRTSWNLVNVALALATMVGVDLVLIPRLGGVGAAFGLAAAVAVNNLLPLAQVRYVVRVHPFGAGTLVAAGLSAGCFGVLPALSVAVAGTGFAAATGTLAAVVGLYAAGLRRFRRLLALDALADASRRSA
jgi:O-antigen/teichoic acid export membrane protein